MLRKSYFKITVGIVLVLTAIVLVLEGLTLISNNTLPFLSSEKLAEKFSPRPPIDPYKFPSFNENEKTMTYFYSVSKIESVELKDFFFKKYAVITLRPKVGKDFYKDTYKIEVPTTLKSTGEVALFPSDLRSKVGQQVGVNVIFKDKKPLYTFYDIKSWEIVGFI